MHIPQNIYWSRWWTLTWMLPAKVCVHTHTHTHIKQMDQELPQTWSHPLVTRTRTSGRYAEALQDSVFCHFPGARLGTRRNSLTVPLVHCWHTRSNLDPTSYYWHYKWGWCFLSPADARSLLIFTARYTGAMGIKWPAQSHNSKALAGFDLPTLGLGVQDLNLSPSNTQLSKLQWLAHSV